MTIKFDFLKHIKSITQSYNKLSTWGQVLVFVALLLLLVAVFKKTGIMKEGFEFGDQFLMKTGIDVYDKFYADIYDHITFNDIDNEHEVGEIINKTSPTKQSRLLDVGCGTGHNVADFASKGFDIIGMDVSAPMIQKAKSNYPEYQFMVGDALKTDTFPPNSFTHITLLDFTLYYIKNKRVFFENAIQWLMPGGYLIVHLVDKNNFNDQPEIKINLEKYDYVKQFKMNSTTNVATIDEKFKDKSNHVRKNEHLLYMEDVNDVSDVAQGVGFIFAGKINMMSNQYGEQYLYLFIKPN
jgi:SAM-dependent methyltransferase